MYTRITLYKYSLSACVQFAGLPRVGQRFNQTVVRVYRYWSRFRSPSNIATHSTRCIVIDLPILPSLTPIQLTEHPFIEFHVPQTNRWVSADDEDPTATPRVIGVNWRSTRRSTDWLVHELNVIVSVAPCDPGDLRECRGDRESK